MSIEDEIFGKYSVDKNKLAEYGFKAESGRLIYTRKLEEQNFLITVEYSNDFRGRITDLDTGEEYINYRLEKPTGFSAEVRESFTNLLTDIRAHCCVNRHYKSAQTLRTIERIAEFFGDSPEFLWKSFPDFAAVRKKSNGKWYALFGCVAKNKVVKSSPNTDKIEVVNVKTPDSAEFSDRKGYYPAYHMNKKNWISIILDDTLEDGEILDRITDSYNIV